MFEYLMSPEVDYTLRKRIENKLKKFEEELKELRKIPLLKTTASVRFKRQKLMEKTRILKTVLEALEP